MPEFLAFGSGANVNPAIVQSTLQATFDVIKNQYKIISTDFIRNPITGQFSVTVIIKI